MKIAQAKTSGYNAVDSICIYEYIREYAARIYSEVEPIEDSTGNAYKAKQEQFAACNRARLKQIAAQLETVCKELDYMLYGRY